MAEIAYEPWRRIVVHEIKEMKVADFFQMVITQFEAQKQVGVPAIQWGEGVAYVRGDFPDTPEIIQEKLKGILHLAMVSFARTSYQEQKRITVGGREHIVKFVKVDDNPDLLNLCRFLSGFKGTQSPANLTEPSP